MLEEGRVFIIILAKDLFKRVLFQVCLVNVVQHAWDWVEFRDRLVIRRIQVMHRGDKLHRIHLLELTTLDEALKD